MPRQLPQHRIIQESHLAAHVRQAAVGGGKGNSSMVVAHHPQHPDVYPVAQILLAHVLRDLQVFQHGSDVELLSFPVGKFALSRESSDTAQNGLVGIFQLDQEKLAVHGQVLEIVTVRQHQIGVELQAALLETAKDAYYFVLGEKLHLSPSVAPSRRIGVLQTEYVQSV